MAKLLQFFQVHPKPAFSEKKIKKSKIAQKEALAEKTKKHCGANGIILKLVTLKDQRLEKI